MGSIPAPSATPVDSPVSDAFSRKPQQSCDKESSVLRCGRGHWKVLRCGRGHGKDLRLRLRHTLSVSADRLRERAPSKINTGHSHGALFSQPSSTLPQTPAGAPACVESCGRTPPGRGSRLGHTCHTALQKTEHPRASAWTPRALRRLLLWEYISSSIKLQVTSNMEETQLKFPQSAAHVHGARCTCAGC